MQDSTLEGRVALVTGGARRVGAAIVRCLHAAGMNVAIHYRSSEAAALDLVEALERQRSDSTRLVQADLLDGAARPLVVQEAAAAWGRLDALVHNASVFGRKPLASVTEADWDTIMGVETKAPFFLAQAAAPHLARHGGCIVHLLDLYGDRPLPDYPVYCAAKGGLAALTRVLARELAPDVRVNAVAPGAVLWPEPGPAPSARAAIINRTPLQRQGEPEEVARAVRYLVRDATFTTGHTIGVDGGRPLRG